MSKNEFQADDVVRCLASHYKSYSKGDIAVVRDTVGHGCIQLDNNLTDYGSSTYSNCYWELVRRPVPLKQEKPQMAAFEKTKYFGVRLSKEQKFPNVHVDIDNEEMTELVDSKSQAIKDVQGVIGDDEEWIILQTIAKIKPAEPKPPIVVTEYR